MARFYNNRIPKLFRGATRMKNTGIKNKDPYIEITITKKEAQRILMDLEILDTLKDLMPETKLLMQMLNKFEETK